MKIGVISDIHWNYEALKSVLGELDRLNVTKIYCLGDVVDYYSQVNECCDELIARNIPSLMGNHDWYMASGGFCPRHNSVNDCLMYQRKVITDKNLKWVKSNAIERFVGNIHMVHGGWSDPIDEYLFEPSEEYFQELKEKYLCRAIPNFKPCKCTKIKPTVALALLGSYEIAIPKQQFPLLKMKIFPCVEWITTFIK